MNTKQGTSPELWRLSVPNLPCLPEQEAIFHFRPTFLSFPDPGQYGIRFA
jgi:hypothetical protein